MQTGSTSSAKDAPPLPANADLNTTWEYLQEGIDHIMTRLHTGISYSTYMGLYTVSYNYCTSSRMHSAVPSGGRGKSLLKRLPLLGSRFTVTTQAAGANLMGSDLYYKFVEYFRTHLAGLNEVRHTTCVRDGVDHPARNRTP